MRWSVMIIIHVHENKILSVELITESRNCGLFVELRYR